MKTFTGKIAKLLVTVLVVGSMPFGEPVIANAAETENQEAVNHLIINQVYGSGGKGETPITNSFIELYNPTEAAVSLDGYSVVCGEDKLELTAGKTIEAGKSYLIVCKAEETTDDLISYDLPDADQTWEEYAINNKNYTITLKDGENEVDAATADGTVLKISKQKSMRRKNYIDTDDASDWAIIVWEKASVAIDENYINQYAPYNSKGENGDVHTVASPIEPTYTPVVAGNKKVAGFNNGKSTLDIEQFARYNSGALNADGGSLEIVEYNSTNGFAYAVSGLKGKIIATKVSDTANGETIAELTGTEYDVKELVASKEGFTYGDITSVSVSPDGKKLAAAVQHSDYATAGMVAIFDCNMDGSLTNPTYISTGVQPDMVLFMDANTILTADEGEPRNGYGEGCTDPKGSVSIINVKENSSVQVGFEAFTAEELINKNIILGIANGNVITPEYDLEPEYIAVSSDGKKAYVSLQEANAIAVLDLAEKKFTGIYSVGFEDYSKVAVDIVEDGKYEAATYDNLIGARMPDGIAVYENGGKTYVVTANEGDSREWGDYLNEAKTKDFTGKNIRILSSDCCAGLPTGKSVMFGGRGITILEVAADGLKEVYDSGNDFEKITGETIPKYFNCSNDDNKADSRSPKKGPEPENVTVGLINGKAYAFVAVERIGGIMVYDITDPAKASYVNYINSREFDAEIQGDVSPEGLCFVENSKSGNPMLLAACEVSGTMPVYELKAIGKTPEEDKKEPDTEHKPDSSATNKPDEKPAQTPGENTPQTPAENPADKKNEEQTLAGTVISDAKTKASYKVIASDADNKTVQYQKSTDTKAKKITIPDTVTLNGITYKVETIAKSAFKNNTKITKVTIGDNVKSIEEEAFSGCKNLKTVKLGKNVTSIGDKAFYNCGKITSITIPSKVNKIGKQAFSKCKSLKKITIKTTKLTSKNVGSKAFKGIHSKVVVKAPKSKLKAYKSILKEKGAGPKAEIQK
ncbi:MAG: choice-of-anchor I family protein [Clostridiales bacterium]|nr:choice-of-anchor I family protein [Clostridiales bacterium]